MALLHAAAVGTREVPRSEWAVFLRAFGRAHRSWLSTVEVASAGGPWRLHASGKPLDRIEIRQRSDATVSIEVHLHGEETPIVAANASVVEVPLSSEGAERGLDIVVRDGARTRLRFRTAVPLEAVDGMAPGELA